MISKCFLITSLLCSNFYYIPVLHDSPPSPVLGTDYSCPIFVTSLLSALLKVVGSRSALILVSLRIPLHRRLFLFRYFNANVFKGGSAALQTRHTRDSSLRERRDAQMYADGCRCMSICAPFPLLARWFNRKLLRTVYGRCSGRSRRARLAVYFVPALIKVKFHLSPISTHLSVSIEAAVCLFFVFFPLSAA